MTEATGSAQVDAFIAWLEQVIDHRVTRVQLGQILGAGGMDKIDEDLSRAYLPSWGYVLATYVNPVNKITEIPLSADEIGKGRQLYKAAALVAKPSLPRTGIAESYSSVVAPVLAGLSLPAIAPWRQQHHPAGSRARSRWPS
jgi:hypothetical protein